MDGIPLVKTLGPCLYDTDQDGIYDIYEDVNADNDLANDDNADNDSNLNME